MAAPGKVTILLADEDSLRRDGLTAVLSASTGFEVVSGVPDGEAAIAQIRDKRPDVAVIDLNLPKIHGIELVRRVRSEGLPTKIVVMAGTNDDEIVREVVRAGADGYLLKNGPSRHLVDAISYVRDGGQYFSPQLQRDGRDRHLLQEPPRPAQQASAQPPVAAADLRDFTEETAYADEAAVPSPAPKPRRRNDPATLRQRMREESSAPQSLNDHDYEIMSMMADGIRPILDRLEEIDSRVAMMESGAEELPGDPRAWLSTELVRTYDGNRGGRENALVGRTVADMEARLPHLIEEAVTKRFNHMAGRLQQEIEETHVRTLESFVKNIQVKLVQRVSALETDVTRQAEAVNQLRDYSQRTEENLSRLITGVDNLVRDLPARLSAARASSAMPVGEAGNADEDEILPPAATTFGPPQRSVRRKTRTSSTPIPNPLRKFVIVGVLGAAVLGTVGWKVYQKASEAAAFARTKPGSGTTEKPAAAPVSSDPKSRVRAATEAMDRKDYAVAEAAFRAVLQTEPQNVEAIKGLASVLFRQDKTDEAAAVLDRMPKD